MALTNRQEGLLAIATVAVTGAIAIPFAAANSKSSGVEPASEPLQPAVGMSRASIPAPVGAESAAPAP
jgi:hypothetical protein